MLLRVEELIGNSYLKRGLSSLFALRGGKLFCSLQNERFEEIPNYREEKGRDKYRDGRKCSKESGDVRGWQGKQNVREGYMNNIDKQGAAAAQPFGERSRREGGKLKADKHQNVNEQLRAEIGRRKVAVPRVKFDNVQRAKKRARADVPPNARLH